MAFGVGRVDEQLLRRVRCAPFSGPAREARAASSVAVLPGSVSTSPQPARDSVVAMRSAGKCGSMGR